MVAARSRPEARAGKPGGGQPGGAPGKWLKRLAANLSGGRNGELPAQIRDQAGAPRSQAFGGGRGGPAGERHGMGAGALRVAFVAALARGWRQRGPRAALGACLLALWIVGYFGVAHSPLVLRARPDVLPWDCPIPFSGWAVWIYLAGLPMIAAPLLLLRAGRPLRRAVLAYLAAIIGATACFAAFPVASGQLRAAADGAGLGPLTALALAALRALDPPFNSFPSLHVALAALAAWSMADAAPGTRAGWNLALALVAWSVCAVKQHYLLDVAGGLALALAVRAWVGARVARPSLPRRKTGRRRACQAASSATTGKAQSPGAAGRGGRRRPLGAPDAEPTRMSSPAASLKWTQALGRSAAPSLGRPLAPARAASRNACGPSQHGDAASSRRQRLFGAARRNRCRALLLLARLHPSRKSPRAARSSWRTLPRAALPLALVFALFVVFYLRAG